MALQVRRLVIHCDHAAEAAKQAQQFLPGAGGLLGSPGAARSAWIGSPAALAAFGVVPEDAVSVDALALALQGRHVRTKRRVRTPGLIVRESPAAPWHHLDGLDYFAPAAERTALDTGAGVQHVGFSLAAPGLAAEVWRRSGPAERAAIERALLAGVEQAIAHMALTRAPSAAGMAGFAAVDAVSYPRNRFGLKVHGALVGVQRDDKRLVSVDWSVFSAERTKREADAIAARALVDALPWLRYAGRQAATAVLAFQQRAPTPALRARRVPTRDPLEDWRELVGDRRADQIDQRASARRHELADLDDAQLLALRRALTAQHSRPDRAVALQALSLERDVAWHEEASGAGRRDLHALEGDSAYLTGRLKRRDRALVTEAALAIRHRIADHDSARERLLQADQRLPARQQLDAWMEGHLEQAAQLVAIDRHLVARRQRAPGLETAPAGAELELS